MKIGLPNILTVLRILLTPLFVICLLRGMVGFSLLVFVIAAVTDALDGFLAKVLDQRTELGSYLDPIADKLLLTTSFVAMAVLKTIPAWLMVIVISRDVLIATGILVLSITGNRVRMRPSRISKCTTAVQLTTVLLVLMKTRFIQIPDLSILAAYWTTATLTVVSGIHYLYVGMNLFQEEEKDRGGSR